MKIIGFAFKENLSAQILSKIKVHKRFYIASHYNEIDRFVTELIIHKPRYILGLGMYSGRDREKLRIETQCKFETEKLTINNFFKSDNHSKLANGIGNSYCNYISYRIMKIINDGNLNIEYTFIHIPKSFDINLAQLTIDGMLEKSRRIQE
jgi:pyrrolidone-carboxylate peptidase